MPRDESTSLTRAMRVFTLRLAQAHGAEAQKARTSMTLLETLLAETVPRLNANFATLGTLVASRRTAGSAAATGATDSTDATHAMDVAMTAALDDSVIALQFSDLASQMVQHTKACLDALDRLGRQLERLHDVEDDAAIERLQSDVEGMRLGPACPARTLRGTAELF